MRYLLALALALALLPGCATSLSHLTPPQALEPGDWQVTGAWTGQVSSVPVSKTLQSGADLWERYASGDAATPLTEEELRRLLDTGLAWILFTPGSNYELGGRVGLSDRPLHGVDLGLRTNLSEVRGDVKLQVWEQEGAAAALNLGYGYHFSMVGSAVEWMTLTEFTRHDLDLGATVGLEAGEWLRLWTGPRHVRSWVRAAPKLDERLVAWLPPGVADLDPHQWMEDASIALWGMNNGGMVGWRNVFLVAELNLFWMDFHPVVLDQVRDFSGLVVAPDVGLALTW